MSCSHARYGAAALTIDTDAGPSHWPPVSSAITDPNPAAAEDSSEASASQAVAAATIGPDPGPEYILPELISGGNAPKSSTGTPPSNDGRAGGRRGGGRVLGARLMREGVIEKVRQAYWSVCQNSGTGRLMPRRMTQLRVLRPQTANDHLTGDWAPCHCRIPPSTRLIHG
ncbi:hypothetical protein MHEI_19210 [Mycobacterium heidelbergense]|nr:hypothetical protein MHEI_19210 [Mycobacterium heidelbergense]